MEYCSIGKFTNEWITNATICYNKWEQYLPQISDIKLKPNNEKTIKYLVNYKFDLLIKINRLVNSKAYRIRKLLLKLFQTLSECYLNIEYHHTFIEMEQLMKTSIFITNIQVNFNTTLSQTMTQDQ